MQGGKLGNCPPMKQWIVEKQGYQFFVENGTPMSGHFPYEMALPSGVISSPSGLWPSCKEITPSGSAIS